MGGSPTRQRFAPAGSNRRGEGGDEIVEVLTGWANYFCLGTVIKAYRAIDTDVVERLRWLLCKKHKAPNRGTARFSYEQLYQELGLKRLTLTTRNLPWAKA